MKKLIFNIKIWYYKFKYKLFEKSYQKQQKEFIYD